VWIFDFFSKLLGNLAFDFAKQKEKAMGQDQMCHFGVSQRILKFLHVGKIPVEITVFSCHDEAFLEAGICHVIPSINAVYLHFRLAHNSFIKVL
jgi:hypothetical protein